jgi:hypothetical protein
MSLSANKIILANAVTNTAGAYFQTATVYTGTGATTGVAIPAGIWTVLPPSTNVVIQLNTSNNASSLTWVNLAAVNVGVPLFISDGKNVQAISSNTSNITVTLYGSNSGQAVSGTYNNV